MLERRPGVSPDTDRPQVAQKREKSGQIIQYAVVEQAGVGRLPAESPVEYEIALRIAVIGRAEWQPHDEPVGSI